MKSYTYKFDFDGKYNLSFADTKSALGFDPETNADLLALITQTTDGIVYEESPVHQWYFAGWYTNAARTQEYDPNTYTPAANATEIILYAGWNTKVAVNIDYGANVLGYTGTTVYVVPGETFTLLDVYAGDSDVQKAKYFKEWTIDGAVTINRTTGTVAVDASGTVTVTATWNDKNVVKITWDRKRHIIGGYRPAIGTQNSSSFGNYTFKSDGSNAGEVTVYVVPNQSYDITIYAYDGDTIKGSISSVSLNSGGNGSLSGTTKCDKGGSITDLVYKAGDATSTVTTISINIGSLSML